MIEDTDYKTLETGVHENVLFVTMNRAEIHNAFNEEVIEELTEIFNVVSEDNDIRAVVLSGKGKSFCAGADLNWMKKMIRYSKDENLSDSLLMAAMYDAIDTCTKPVIGRINGAAFGGGVGLVAVCDIAVANQDALFAFSEVKLGIVPAVISPYIVSKIGMSHARALFTTGERFGAEKAKEIGLVHEVAPIDKLDDLVNFKLKSLKSSGPKAVSEAKELLRGIAYKQAKDSHEFTAAKIAELRVSEEGQEGLTAFLAKEKPSWRKD